MVKPKLIWTKSDTAIASVVVLRIMNQSFGPAEIMRSGYGYTQYESHNENEYTGHKHAKVIEDDVDGKIYVEGLRSRLRPESGMDNLSDILVRAHADKNQGATIPSVGEVFDFEELLTRTVPFSTQDLKVSFDLYANEFDQYMEDRYPLNHTRNKSKSDPDLYWF